MSAVPYKPYQSKRHSRNLSNNFTPPQSPPLVAVGSPSRTSNPQSSNDASKRLSIPPISFNYIDNALVDLSPSPPASVPPPQAAIVTPPVISNGHTPEPEPEPEPEPVLPAPVPTPIAVPVAIVEVPPSPISEPATPRIVEEQRQSEPEPKTADVKANDETDETPATSATPPPVPSKGDLAPAVPRPRPLSMSHSTFRHVPARASPLRPSSSIIKSGMSAPSSPLGSGPFTNHSSFALGPQSRPSTAAGSTSHFRPRTTSALSAASPRVLDFSPGQSPLPSPSANGAQPSFPSSPSLQAQARPSMGSSLSSSSSVGAFSPSKSPHSTPAEIASPSKGTSAPPSAPSSPSRPPISPSPSPNPGSSALPSGSSTSTVQAPRPRVMSSNAASRTSSNVGSAPYRHGFQPKGVYGLRTDEFLELRRTKRDLSRIEDRRLERRLEKLINLHFSSGSNSDTPDPSKPPANRRQSSFFDFDLSDLKGKNASDLWRGMLDSAATSRLGGGNHAKGEIRLQEQAITPWQEDALVPACPICLTSFNTLTNRKHHCRLCGKVVCALPVKPPQRAELCSFLFVVESGTGKIEELGGDMVDYGVKRKDLTPGASGDAAKKLMEEQEKYLKGVRICKDCRPTLRRRQYSVEAKTVPPFARLYAALLELEREIEEMLPTFQEVVIRLS
ncbi:hypothetical protein M408DRAFT_301403 [Serendipita vermifera MAFF 305830]|uniref:FYVE-type domain-containing protein n=1 Tax=Serendipita vermifera MAFF 305830 TaxID=933852 RepID=A0A0C3AAS6_SERVB|nr:hypothetical protein M408DRAFT_301403 [Serendipita vermifera MAFF 305830]